MNKKTEKKETEKTKIFTLKNERVVSAIVIIIMLVGLLVSFMANVRIVYTAIMALISAAAVYEMITIIGCKSKLLSAVSALAGIFSVFAVSYDLKLPDSGVLYGIFALVILSLSIFDHKKIKYTDAVMAIFSSVSLPQAFSCLIRLNDISAVNPEYKHYEGVYFVGLAFVCSWLTDTFAYIVGSKLGKHKLCPEISPKKSIEGAIGGVVIAGLFAPLLLFIFNLIGVHFWDYEIFGAGYMKYLFVIPITVALSVFSMLGDLAASILKRNLGVKDYSNLIPGHGGIMDRFDSCTFVFPGLYIILYLISL